MPFQRLRRAILAATLALSAFVVACGGGTIQSSFVPARGVLLDGAGSTWAQVTLSAYGNIPITAPTGGMDYSLGSAPISDLTFGTPTLSQRIDTLLAGGGVNASDLVFVSGGVPDILATGSTVVAAAAGQAMGDQIRRLVNAGARRIVVANAYDPAITPSGQAQTPLFNSLTRAFNDQLKISIVDLGANVLLVDAEQYFFQVRAIPSAFNFTDVSNPACAGSTRGNGSVSASACTTGAFGGNNVNTFLFYDPVFLTPAAQTSFAGTVFSAARNRW